MSNESNSRPNVNPDGGKAGADEQEVSLATVAERATVDVGKLDASAVVGADMSRLIRQMRDPFATYQDKAAVPVGTFIPIRGRRGKPAPAPIMVSATHLVFYKGKLPNDPAMEGAPVEHQCSFRGKDKKMAAVVFNRRVGNIPYPAAIVSDHYLRAQLMFKRYQGKMVDRADIYGVLDGDQIERLGQTFALACPGESPLVRQIAGSEE